MEWKKLMNLLPTAHSFKKKGEKKKLVKELDDNQTPPSESGRVSKQIPAWSSPTHIYKEPFAQLGWKEKSSYVRLSRPSAMMTATGSVYHGRQSPPGR